MYTPWSSTTAAPPLPLDRPVWVDLDTFYGEPDENVAGFDEPFPGGLLKGDWSRSRGAEALDTRG